MNIKQDDAQILIFEENPATNPNKLLFLLPIIGVILSRLNEQVNIMGALLEIVEIEAILGVFFLLLFLFRKFFPVKVKIDKANDSLAITNLNIFFLFTPQPVTIPLQKIKEIQHYPFALFPTSLFTRSKLVFIVDDENGTREVAINIPDNIFFFKNYENIGKKIATFIGVSFTM